MRKNTIELLPSTKEAWESFVLSRKAAGCRPTTLDFYQYTALRFLIWAQEIKGISKPDEITAKIIRLYLAKLIDDNKKDWTIQDNARAIRTLVRYWSSDNIINDVPKFDIPKIHKKYQLALTASELGKVLSACETKRDKALLLLMVDTGLRRSEVASLTWADIDIARGICSVHNGKGGKDRYVVMGKTALKTLTEYKKQSAEDSTPNSVFLTYKHKKLTSQGILQVFIRLRKKSGTYVTPHSMRRTFVRLSLRAGMNPLHLKELLGHESMEMVNYYARLDIDDLAMEHTKHSPVDNLANL